MTYMSGSSSSGQWPADMTLFEVLEDDTLILAGFNEEAYAAASDADWDPDEIPDSATAQGNAFLYFQDMDSAILRKLGVKIVEGDVPGSNYFAAQVKIGIDEANDVAERLDLEFRFV